MNLLQDIIDSVERRWAAKLQQEVEAWRQRKRLNRLGNAQGARAPLCLRRKNARRYSIGSDFAA